MEAQTKTCRACGKVKPIAEFYKSRNGNGSEGREARCKDCKQRERARRRGEQRMCRACGVAPTWSPLAPECEACRGTTRLCSRCRRRPVRAQGRAMCNPCYNGTLSDAQRAAQLAAERAELAPWHTAAVKAQKALRGRYTRPRATLWR